MLARLDSLLHPLAHVAVGILAALMVCPPEFQYIIAGSLSALLPDLDVEIGLPHRAQSHSIVPPLLLYIFYASAPDKILLAVIAGYASHLIVDLLHGNGIMLFYPITRIFVSFAHVEPRYIAFVAMPLLFFFYSAPPSEPPIVKALATPYQFYPTPTATDWKGLHVHVTVYTPLPSATSTPLIEGYHQIIFGTYTPTPAPSALAEQRNFLTTIATNNAP